MIKLNDIRFAYSQSAFHLRIPQLTITRGEKVAIVGASGSGKTTLLNLLAGISIPQQGEIIAGETAVHDLSDAQRRNFRISQIGFIFQEFELIDYLTVYENILYPYFINRFITLTSEIKQRAKALAASLGIQSHLKQSVKTLSQGEKQRVAICRAMLSSPNYLFADEPTGNLDPTNKATILNLLFEQAKQSNATLVMVTHDHTLLERFDRVIDVADITTEGRT
jgi:ABC-type lipoprotein export system ATPase subunit